MTRSVSLLFGSCLVRLEASGRVPWGGMDRG